MFDHDVLIIGAGLAGMRAALAAHASGVDVAVVCTPTHVRSEVVIPLIEAGVPCCPVNTLDRVFADPQVKARNMRIELDHPAAEDLKVPLVASPIKMSATPPSHRRPPPMLGQHTEEVLRELLELADGEIVELRNAEVI